MIQQLKESEGTAEIFTIRDKLNEICDRLGPNIAQQHNT
jgi:hypothetical protein